MDRSIDKPIDKKVYMITQIEKKKVQINLIYVVDKWIDR